MDLTCKKSNRVWGLLSRIYTLKSLLPAMLRKYFWKIWKYFCSLAKCLIMRETVKKYRDAAKALSRYEPFFQNNISLLSKAKKGLQVEAVFDFILISDLPNEQVEAALNKSMKTFQNYKEKKTILDTTTSEKLLKLFALYSKGAEIFGSIDTFSDWLSRPAYGIGKQVPQDLLDTMTGIDLITDELKRIEYGDLA